MRLVGHRGRSNGGSRELQPPRLPQTMDPSVEPPPFLRRKEEEEWEEEERKMKEEENQPLIHCRHWLDFGSGLVGHWDPCWFSFHSYAV